MSDEINQEGTEEQTPAPAPVAAKDPVEAMIESLRTEEQIVILEEIPFSIKFPDGKAVPYFIREMDATRRGKYLSYQASTAQIDSKGGLKGFGDVKLMEIRAVSLSLFDADKKPVPEAVISALPGKLIAKLAKVALRISGLDDHAEGTAKND